MAKPSKCLATVAFEAGRFSIAGLSATASVQAFVDFNKRALEEIRRCLWLELKANNDLFDVGQELMSDPAIPEVEEAEELLRAISRADIRNGAHLKKLTLSERQVFGLALKILRYRARGGKSTSTKQMHFARSIIDHSKAQPYFEATTKAFNAAYHIVLIDAPGANCQPIDDIPFDCFSGKTKRGKQAIRSVRLQKNRKGGEAVPGKLKEDAAETQFYVETKGTTERPSGIVVIEIWKKLSEGMREKSGPTSERLWLWRVAGNPNVETALVSMSSDRWPAFTQRHVSNPIFGGLPLTRQMIRTTVRNARSDARDLDFVVEMARMGHAVPRTSFEYLSEGAVRASLASKIREFLDVWEATSVLNIEDAALRLGVPSGDLFRRAQLGLENGLSFAAVNLTEPLDAEEDYSSLLSPGAQVLRVTLASLLKLELARRALRQQFSEMLNVNPLRLIRTWIPWLAIVEGFCEKLEQTRFRLQLKRARVTVDEKLQSGEMRIPLLW
ncbi:hypothetical protein ACC671_11010 [Rhizobium ruizarguesonis]